MVHFRCQLFGPERLQSHLGGARSDSAQGGHLHQHEHGADRRGTRVLCRDGGAGNEQLFRQPFGLGDLSRAGLSAQRGGNQYLPRTHHPWGLRENRVRVRQSAESRRGVRAGHRGDQPQPRVVSRWHHGNPGPRRAGAGLADQGRCRHGLLVFDQFVFRNNHRDRRCAGRAGAGLFRGD